MRRQRGHERINGAEDEKHQWMDIMRLNMKVWRLNSKDTGDGVRKILLMSWLCRTPLPAKTTIDLARSGKNIQVYK